MNRRAVSYLVISLFVLLSAVVAALFAGSASLAQLNTTDEQQATQTVQAATSQPLTATAIATQYANVVVKHNADWTPVIQTVNGVEMVLVPPGCFMLGSENGDDDEKPVNQQCFDKLFWIDRYEVTNAQFAQFNGQAGRSSAWTDANRPREQITWFEARDFCALRGARLPTEAEWEYATRGPDSLVYPWGNDFAADNVVYDGNSDDHTWDVGSKPGGISWVGAMDLSGNIWEWVSSLYKPYPYVAGDGRENNEDTNSARALRGGSWVNENPGVRSANRFEYVPDNQGGYFGFRCASAY